MRLCWLLTITVTFAGFTRAEGGQVSIAVDEPSRVVRKGWPVTSGIPLPRGALADDQAAALFNGDRELPLQTEILSRWSDGSIRWLLLDFPIDLEPGERRQLTLRYGTDVRRARIPDGVKVIRGSE